MIRNGKVSQYVLISGAGLVLLFTSCSDKKGPGPTGPSPTGGHQIVLRANDTLFYNTDNVIIVRTFNPDGTTGVNAQINSVCGSPVPDNVTPHVDGQSDTIAHPTGSNPPLRYFGLDTTISFDVVTSYWILNGDTVADTSVAFKLATPP